MRTYHFGSVDRNVREIFKRNIKNKDGKGFEMRVKRVAAVVTAVAALLAGALGGASTAVADETQPETPQAPRYTSADDFQAGALKNTEEVTLKVTKYTSLSKGVNATGSENDQKNAEGAPASGVVFKLTHIVPTTGHTAADLNPQCATGASQTCKAVSGSPSDPNPVYGVTGPDGTITAWYKTEADAQQADTSKKVTLPKEHRYYLLQEDASTAPHGYTSSEDSVFDLPFRT